MAASTTPRVFLRPPSTQVAAAAIFGTSMFNVVRQTPPDGADGAPHRPHYERCSVRLDELRTNDGEAVVVVGPAVGGLRNGPPLEEENSLPPDISEAGVTGSWGILPFARAIADPSLLSLDCPAVGLSRIGWYDGAGDGRPADRPRRRDHTSLGVVGAVLDDDGRVLLTRRARHMRSFPRAWVMPGGGVDSGETLTDAVIREITEETGVVVERDGLEPVGLWESAYPTSTEECVEKGKGLLAHHLVIFFVGRVARSAMKDRTGEIKITLQEEETDAAVWLSPIELSKTINCPLGNNDLGMTQGVEISHGVLESDQLLPLNTLSGIYPRGADLCGIAQGNMYMLEELLSAGDGTSFGPS